MRPSSITLCALKGMNSELRLAGLAVAAADLPVNADLASGAGVAAAKRARSRITDAGSGNTVLALGGVAGPARAGARPADGIR